MTPGQAAYERELAKQPAYPDGAPRRQWNELKPWMQLSWEQNPTDRGGESADAPKPRPAGVLELEALSKLESDLMKVTDPCLYFLWGGAELLYIGATTQSCDRIARHIRDRNYRNAQSGRPIPFDRYTFLEVPNRLELWPLETEYQTFYDPPYNVVSYRRRIY